MHTNQPSNDLERALAGAMRGPQGYPELFRQLRESELTFLMPYHPEMEGVMELQNGDEFNLTFWKNGEEQVIPLFTSGERAQQALESIGEKDRPCCIAEMEGETLFRILQNYKTKVVINPALNPGGLHLDANAVRMLADGSILHPITGREQAHGRVKIMDPADYPTDFIQPLFEFLRQRKEVQAAWIFETPPHEKETAECHYVFGLLAVDAEEQLEQDFVVVAQNARPKGVQFGVVMLDPRDGPQAGIIAKCLPFYASPGFRPGGAPVLEEE